MSKNNTADKDNIFIVQDFPTEVKPRTIHTRLLPKKIFKEPFGLLSPKVGSPSHLFRGPDKILRGQSGGWGAVGEFEEDGGLIVEILGRGPGAEIFHKTLIWSNINQIL